MTRIEELIKEFKDIAYNPKNQLAKYKSQGKKVIGCFPYYIPEELVYAADMVPMGVWEKVELLIRLKNIFHHSIVQ